MKTDPKATDFYVVVQSYQKTNMFDVEGFVAHGSHLHPVYDGGQTPADESPETEVYLMTKGGN